MKVVITHFSLAHTVNLRCVLLTRSFTNSCDTCSLSPSPRISKIQKRRGEKKKIKEKKNELEGDSV